MSRTRFWNERVLGGVLTLVGLTVLAALIFAYWVGARHMYTVGLSVDAKGLEVFASVIAFFAVMMALGGISLIRRT